MEEQSKKILKEMNEFVVIGLGRFGISVATTLSSLGHEVLAIDKNAENCKSVEKFVSSAVVADATSLDVLKSLGVQNFDCAVVCIGDDIQSSILTTLLCKELGIGYVVSKAQNDQHKKVLEKIGADMVIFPEVFMGKKLASMLSNPSVNEVLNLTDDLKIVEVVAPDKWAGKSIVGLNVRKKYKISIIYIKRDGEVITPEAETVINLGDTLIVSGDKNKIYNLSNLTDDSIDVSGSLADAMTSD